jgi:exopolysaccharide biosynthesis polyprenyl glycosylphosphotransferase
MLRSVDLQEQVNNSAQSSSKLSLEFSERKLLLGTIDLLAIAVGISSSILYQAYRSTVNLNAQLFTDRWVWISLLAICWFSWLYLNDLYELRMAVKLQRSFQRIACGAGVVGVAYALYAIIAPQFGLKDSTSGLAPVLSILITATLLSLWRAAYSIFLGAAHSRERIIIFGAGASGSTLAQTLRHHPHYEIVGFIDDAPELQGVRLDGIPTLGDRKFLSNNSLALKSIGEIVLAISSAVDDNLLQILTNCRHQGIIITPMPVLYEKITGKIAVEHIGSQWYSALPMQRNSFDSLNRLGKRLLDLGCGLMIGSVLLAVFPIIAIAIKLESPGPIFYRQERVGLHGAKFMVYKFRSMVQNAEINGKAQWAVKGDSRITRIGQFLRKTRLDELPQVINVLRGEMSMVGPRPERQQFIDKLQLEIPFYCTRLAAKPGLTGWAQVKYGYGATVEDALIKLQYDLFYLKHWSPWLDFKILLRTFGVVIKMQGQ